MVLVGTRTGLSISAFKQVLTQMQEGDIVRIRGPVGWFVIRDTTSPIVLLATGVGITPMRPILYSLKDDVGRPIHLVHSSPDFHLFSDELQELEKTNSQIKLAFVQNKEEFRGLVTSLISIYGQTAFYYVSCAPNVVKAIIKSLKEQGIQRNRIVRESFLGY